MTATAPIYDLTLLLDPQAEDAARAKVLAETRASIEAHGELVRHDEWGERQLSYPIRKRKSAEYHLLQFHTGENELLSGLERTLHITDGVLRFRLIKLKPGVGAPPDMGAGAPPRRTDSDDAAPAQRAPGESSDAPAEAPDAAVAADPAASADVETAAGAIDVEGASEPDATEGAEDAAAAADAAGEASGEQQ